MKVLSALTLLSIVPLTVACANTDSHVVRQTMLQPVIEQQCQRELKSSKVWRTASLLLSEAKQKNAQQSICGCVGKNALKDVSNQDLVMASVNEDSKNKVIRQAVMNSLTNCAQEVLQ